MVNLILKTDYISQQANIRNLFLNTKTNLYLKKGSTGIGGTTVILESTCANRIVVSPSVGMIQGKEQSINNKHCYFIYSGSKDSWLDFILDKENKVVNCTPDQIVMLKKLKPYIFDELIEMTIFVDEIHQYIPDGDYRENLGPFLDILFNEWRANWILSTATDNTINGQLLDIPPNQKYVAYNIVREQVDKHNIEVRRGLLKGKLIEEIFTDSLSRGRKLIIATNSSKHHKSISQMLGYNIVNLVGSNIKVKLKTHKVAEEVDEVDWNEVDIVMISSKYFAGFDIPLDCDILIDTNPNIISSLINVNNIRQIIGRSRKSVERIILNIDMMRPEIETNTVYQPLITGGYKEVYDKIKLKINDINAGNWFELSAEIISDWGYYCLLYAPLLKAELLRYNYNMIKYDTKQIKSVIKIKNKQFNEQLEHLLGLDIHDLKLDFGRIRKYLKYKIDGIFSPDLAILFYTAIMIKKKDLDITIKPSDKPTRFYQKMNKFFNDDENWNLLYQHQKTKMWKRRAKVPKHSALDPKYDIYLEIRSLPSKELTLLSTGYFDCYQRSLLVLKKKNITPDEYETKKLLSRCKEVFNRKDPNEFKGFRTREQLLNLIGWANLFVLNGGREVYNFPLKRNRIYSPLTQIPGPLRGMLGIKMVEIDIKQANPTFIDGVIGSKIAGEVYDNIMNIYGITRDDAKIRYNTYLNNDKGEADDIYKFFSLIGYTQQQSSDLVELITTRKGAVYDKMVEKEREIIELFADIHLQHINWFRFHDAIVCSESEVLSVLPSIPKKFMNGIELDFKYYNDGTKVKLNKKGTIL